MRTHRPKEASEWAHKRTNYQCSFQHSHIIIINVIVIPTIGTIHANNSHPLTLSNRLHSFDVGVLLWQYFCSKGRYKRIFCCLFSVQCYATRSISNQYILNMTFGSLRFSSLHNRIYVRLLKSINKSNLRVMRTFRFILMNFWHSNALFSILITCTVLIAVYAIQCSP